MSERILLLRTCGPNGEAHDGFLWPLTVGSVVEPKRWDPNPERDCGDALHALAWGEGDGSLLNWSPDARWLVVSADAADVLPARGGKNRCRRVVVEHVGDRESATRYLLDHGAAGRAVVGASVAAGDYGTATAGDRGTATAGDYGTATAGDRGTATAGYEGTATAGDRGTATAGYRGTATAGDEGTATAGDYGTATAGDYGTATAGYRGTATAGYRGTATAGDYGTATAGDRGTVCLRWYDDNEGRSRIAVGYVGESGIEARVAYRADGNGKLIAVAKGSAS